MNIKFEYQSEEFTTQVAMRKEVAKLKESMCEHFGYSRSEIRLQHGMVILWGYAKDIQCYIKLTSTIGDFKKYLGNESYTNYYVSCSLAIKK